MRSKKNKPELKLCAEVAVRTQQPGANIGTVEIVKEKFLQGYVK